MESKSKLTDYSLRTVTILIITLLFVCHSNAQNDSINLLKYSERIIDYTHNKAIKTEEAINRHLNQKDTTYISDNKYRFTFMGQYINNYEYYKFTSINSKQSITLQPDNNDKFGIYVGWKWLFVGWAFDINKRSRNTDWNFSFYTSKIGVDIFYRKCSNGFRIKNLEGFKDSHGNTLKSSDNPFNGIDVRQRGINVYYIFNNMHFSYPAAYSQSTNQRISCGSFILGFNYSQQSFNINTDKFEDIIKDNLDPQLNVNNVKYQDYSINFGYTYNWVFAKNCLANISLTPAIGYKNTSFKLEMNKKFFDNINFDFISRAAIVYNNTRFFVGASLISHTYSYRKTNLSIVNGFGTLNLYFGVNLFRKK